MATSLPRILCLLMAAVVCAIGGCGKAHQRKIVVGSKFFTEQVLLAELLAQHIEARTGIPVERKTNLGGTLLLHKAMLAGELDLYVEYTGTALMTVLTPGRTDTFPALYEVRTREYSLT